MYGYIYKITNLINNKIYIGQHKYTASSKINKKGLDENYFSSGKIINAAKEKYGANNFKIELLEQAETKSDLNNLEKQYIKLFKSNNSDIGYNLTSGGDGGDLSAYIDYSYLHIDINHPRRSISYTWYNNGEKEKQILKDKKIPDGYKKGRLNLSEATKKKIAIAKFKHTLSAKEKNRLSNLWKNR